MLHIGNRIHEVIKLKETTVTKFAEELPCCRVNAYKIFAKDNIDIQQLDRISQVLGHNFIKDLANSIEIGDSRRSGNTKKVKE